MTAEAVTADLLHTLVTGSHAEGVTDLAVQAVISHNDTILLIADPGTDFIDHTWAPPGATVLPGQSLTEALDPMAATLAMSIDEVTGYLGHHDTRNRVIPGQTLFSRLTCAHQLRKSGSRSWVFGVARVGWTWTVADGGTYTIGGTARDSTGVAILCGTYVRCGARSGVLVGVGDHLQDAGDRDA